MTDQVLEDLVQGSITHAARSGGGFSVAREMAIDQVLRNGVDADDGEVEAALNEAYGVEGTPKALGDPAPEDGPVSLPPVLLTSAIREQAPGDVELLPVGTPKPLGVMFTSAPTAKPLGQKLPE